MKKKYIFTAVLLAVLTVLSVFIVRIAADDANDSHTDELHIVASFYPVYIAVENIIADIPGVTAASLTEPTSGCLHDYQLTTSDMTALSEADMFVINGGGMETFLDVVELVYPDLPIVTSSEGLTFLTEDMGEETAEEHEGEEHEEEHDEHEEDHDHGHDHHHHHDHSLNAHVWMDVGRYMVQVRNIAEALIAADPANEDAYRKNTELYEDKLMILLSEMEEVMEHTRETNIVLFHDSFAYAAYAFGLHVSYILEVEEDTSLSAGELAQLIARIKEDEVELLFVEEQYGAKIADAVAAETGTSVYVLDSLVTGDGSLDSYITGMRANLQILKEAVGL